MSTVTSEQRGLGIEPPESFPDHNFFAYVRPTPRLFPIFVCGHYPPGTVAPPHSHPYVALHGCMQGPMTLQTDAGNLRLDEGTFYLIPPGVRHSWRNDRSYTGAVLALLIDPNASGNWPVESGVDACCIELARLVTDLHRFSVSGDGELQHSYWLAADHLTTEDPCEPIMTTGVLLTLLGQTIVRLAADRPRAGQATTAKDVAREIRRLLANRVHDHLDISQIAGAVGVSPTRAKDAFHAAFGCGIISYFNQLKIWHAKRLLCDPSLTIEQVSDCLSFANAGYFSRVFTHLTGQTPSQFRRSTKAQ